MVTSSTPGNSNNYRKGSEHKNQQDDNKNHQWWDDKEFLDKITLDANQIKNNEQPTFSMDEVKKSIKTS